MGSCTRLLVLFPVLLAGCKRSADFYPMPAQQAITPAIPIAPVTLVNMSDGDVNEYIVGGVGESSGANSGANPWRWSKEHPEFTFLLDPKIPYAATLEFAIPEVTFRVTGPVTIEYLVNGNVLESIEYPAAGNYQFEQMVPAQWIQAGSTKLAARIHPVWTSPEDGAHLGVLLMKAGFVPK